MNIAITMALLAAIALFNLSGSTPAHATDMVDFRSDRDRSDCRVVEIRTINRWGDDVTIQRRVCG
jgi:hypothetical protein